jgi:hypothetical protein
MEKYADILALADDFLALAEKVYGPYKRHDGRQFVIVKEDDGTSRTISYPKFLMESHLGRRLDPNLETIDHMDSNFDNNDLENLRIVPRSEHSADDTRRVKLVTFQCAWCGKEFQRSPRLVRDKAKKNKAGPFHNRTCAGMYSRSLQLKLINKFDVQPVIDSAYYKRKYEHKMASSIPRDDIINHMCDIWFEDEIFI